MSPSSFTRQTLLLKCLILTLSTSLMSHFLPYTYIFNFSLALALPHLQHVWSKSWDKPVPVPPPSQYICPFIFIASFPVIWKTAFTSSQLTLPQTCFDWLSSHSSQNTIRNNTNGIFTIIYFLIFCTEFDLILQEFLLEISFLLKIVFLWLIPIPLSTCFPPFHVHFHLVPKLELRFSGFWFSSLSLAFKYIGTVLHSKQLLSTY